MNFSSTVKNFIDSVVAYFSYDQRKAICPNCDGQLKKIPGAKTKCPHCKKYMYIRTKPNKKRVVVTKEEAEKIEEEWRIINGTQEEYLAEKRKFDGRKELLKKKLGGKEPSDNDVLWGLLNEELLQHASQQQWGLYRNVRLQMADILKQEEKLREALKLYLAVCYLDLIGATNMPTDENDELVNDFALFTPFDPDLKFMAPGVVKEINKISHMLKLKTIDVKEIYLEFCSQQQKSIGSPVKPEDCWAELEVEI